MCRLFGYKTENPSATTNDLVKALGEFRVLAKNGKSLRGVSKGHGDGWGIIAYKNGAPALYYRSPKSIIDDNNFELILKSIKNINPEIVISHLRKLSRGGNDVLNTQPFLSGNVSLCHNGTINFPLKMTPGNISDSLSFFQMITETSSKNFSKIFKDNYTKISKRYSYSAMNMLFSDGKNINFIRNWNEKDPSAEKLCYQDYYTLSLYENKYAKFICSEDLASLKKLVKKECLNRKIYSI